VGKAALSVAPGGHGKAQRYTFFDLWGEVGKEFFDNFVAVAADLGEFGG
jgi:hypothetical protein